MTQWIVKIGCVLVAAISGAIAGGVLALLLRKLLHRSASMGLSLLLGFGLTMLLFISSTIAFGGNHAGKLASLFDLFSMETGIMFILIAWLPDLKW